MTKENIIEIITKSNLSKEEKALVIGYINDHNSVINKKETLVIVVLKLMEIAPAIIEHFL